MNRVWFITTFKKHEKFNDSKILVHTKQQHTNKLQEGIEQTNRKS